jgi:uncharacterized membrane protein
MTHLPAVIVVLAGAVAGIWLGAELLRRDAGLGTSAYDAAFFQQLVWSLDHGRGFTSSFTTGSFLGLHFSPLLALPAVLELAWSDPRMLTLLHAVAIALTGPAAYLLLRRSFPPSRAGAFLAAALGAALPFTPVMQEAARAGFHPEALALPAALIAGWAGLSRRPAIMWAAAAAVLLAKEDQVYTAGVIGLLVALRGPAGMRRHGAALVAVAALWGVAVFAFLMPALRAGATVDTASYYDWLGSGPAALLAPIREPGAVLAQLANPAGWMAAAALVAGCAFLPLLRPAWLLLVLPPLAANLLSRHYPQPELHLQYGLLLVVPALVATARGGRAALEAAPTRHQLHRPVALLAAALPALLLGALAGSVPPSRMADDAFGRPPALAQLTSIARTIPTRAPVAADDDVAAALASRPVVRVLPSADRGDYLVVDRDLAPPSYVSGAERRALVARLPRAGRRLLVDDGRFQVWSPAGA